ncbi:hypothetical protein predicted by Glimmer/Critica [Sorangium cellulosum So ce56]|uniref:Uncharacterized protein n=1 Tax=Sorangium cellulosum (strain So ce56) TaxID=448385 RepID=A9GUL8_SORC5|nr:hypothetical protein [Sorangium cellulosum]CAN90639.1 hypothetical protein predicted by Glimmer/Critica [Sorangium cellulosum So ce56]
MPERIVVSFRGTAALSQPDSTDAVAPWPGRRGAPRASAPPSRQKGAARAAGSAARGEESYLARALALKKRAEALGATLCAWSAQTFSFEFTPDDVEEAVLLAALAAEDASVHPDARFAVGIAQGEMTYVGEAGRFTALSWGQPLLVAVMLARVALPGDVLLDPALPAVSSGELMTLGAHRGVDGARRVRGLRLDAQQPLRRQVAESVARLCKPPLIGRDAELAELAVPPGSLAIVRAEPGAGGTRLLLDLERLLAPSRSLFVAPIGASREPFGALRRALARAALRAEKSRARAPALPDRLKPALARLLAGEGVEPRIAAEVLAVWLAPSDVRVGLLAVDDASEVDAASLDAIALALSPGGGPRAVARLGRSDPLPAPLTALTPAATVTLGPLSAQGAQDLVRRLLDGCIDEAGARRWAARAPAFPLAVRELLCEALESGALRWIGRSVGPRRRSAGRGRPPRTMTGAELAAPPALRSIEGRLRLLAIGQRTVLTALATLGGDASDAAIDALCGGTGAPKVAAVQAALLGAGWVFRPEPGWLRLSSRTLRDALLAGVPPGERAAWHLAAARVVEDHASVLGLADAAWHAAKAGDRRSAADLAGRAGRAAGDALLEGSAAELLAFADEQETASDHRDGALDSSSSQPPTHRTPIEVVGDAPEPQRSAPAPAPVGERSRPGAPAAQPDDEPKDFPDATSPDIGLPCGDATEDLLAKTTESPVLSMNDIAVRLAELAKQALVQGDLRTLERLVGELRRTGEHLDLAERMTGLISLGRGAKEEALRRFRIAAEADASPSQRARALLAYGVALAAAGRTEGALLEALSALARAREAEDPHGEQACAQFLAQLAAATGHEEAARAWAQVARLAGAGPPS